MDAISDWVFKNYELCRPQDIFAFIQTSAVLNHQPSNADQLFPVSYTKLCIIYVENNLFPLQILLRNLNYSEASDANTWLDVIWSLVLLNLATEEHLSSVLAENFVQRIGKCCSYLLKIATKSIYFRDKQFNKQHTSKVEATQYRRICSTFKELQRSTVRQQYETVTSC